MSRALILGPGGLRGAYTAGVVAVLGRELGRDYFDTVYCSSAGAYTGSYVVSGQSHMPELLWRNRVHGMLLMRWHNPFLFRPILDLYYLNGLLRSERYRLAVGEVINSPVKMVMVVLDLKTGKPHYLTPKTPEEFFLQVRASAAVRYLHPSVIINGRRYADGHNVDPFPIARAISDGHDDIIVVCNQFQYDPRRLVGSSACRVRVISPSINPPLRWNFDSSKNRINRMVDLGIADTLTFLT